MKCKKCGTEFETGAFCPNCGTKCEDSGNERNNEEDSNSTSVVMEKRKKKPWILLVIIGLLAFYLINSNIGYGKQNKKIDELKSQLSETVTKDSLPGTYVSKDGQVFAIDVENKDIFKINPTLAKIFQGDTSTGCMVVFPNVSCQEESAYLDVADKTIEIISDDLIYKYKLNLNYSRLCCESGCKPHSYCI